MSVDAYITRDDYSSDLCLVLNFCDMDHSCIKVTLPSMSVCVHPNRSFIAQSSTHHAAPYQTSSKCNIFFPYLKHDNDEMICRWPELKNSGHTKKFEGTFLFYKINWDTKSHERGPLPGCRLHIYPTCTVMRQCLLQSQMIFLYLSLSR